MRNIRYSLKLFSILVCSVIVFLILFYLLFGEPKKIYELPKAELMYNIHEDGLVDVEERITYLMVKPYRGIRRYVSFPIYMSVENPRISIEGAKLSRLEWLENSPVKLDFKVYISDQAIKPKKDGDLITLILKYRLKGALEVGRDFSQFFPKAWGEKWQKKLQSLKVTVNLPKKENFFIFFHPKKFVERYEKTEDTLYIMAKNIPAGKGFEFRVLFDKPFHGEYVHHIDKSIEDVLKIERRYTLLGYILTPISFLIVLVVIALPILLYIRFGREPKVKYEAEYEREIPYKDHPAFVNMVVKKEFGFPDAGAIGSTMVRLHRMKFITFEKDRIRIVKKPDDLSENEKNKLHPYDTDLLKKLDSISKDGWINMKNLERDLKKSSNMAKDFYKNMKEWFEKVFRDTLKVRKKFIKIKGYVLSKISGFIYVFSAIFLYIMIGNPVILYHPLADSIFRYSIVFMGAIAFFMILSPRSFFGSWTEYGRLYRLRWLTFQRYITDFSALSEHPPESVEIWDQYMVYAIALGVAKRALSVFKKFAERMKDGDLIKRFGEYETDLVTVSTFSTLYSISSSSVNRSSGSSDTKSWGGNVGGGFGGGGGDAF